MPRVTGDRRSLLNRARGDRGAAATLVAVLLAGGVLLGMTALVVDVGKLYVEREQLLSTADSVAMAVATECALDREGCEDEPTVGQFIADATERYADGNMRDGLAEVFVCGSDARLPDCDDDTQFHPRGNLTDCLNERPDNGAKYVEVRVNTLTSGDDSGDDTLLPPSFAQTLVSGHEGTSVGACSRVAYGGVAGGLAATLSMCEWQGAVLDENGEPQYADLNMSEFEIANNHEVKIYLHNNFGQADCFNGPPHYDGNGGFGWLEDDEGDCLVEITDNLYRSNQGNNADNPCRTFIPLLRDSDPPVPVPVPVYREVTHAPPGLTYELARIELFVITGYKLTGSIEADSNLDGSDLSCTLSDRCLIGYFIDPNTELDWDGAIGDPSIPGPVVIRTVG